MGTLEQRRRQRLRMWLASQWSLARYAGMDAADLGGIGVDGYDTVARNSFAYADAMLAEADKPKKEGS